MKVKALEGGVPSDSSLLLAARSPVLRSPRRVRETPLQEGISVKGAYEGPEGLWGLCRTPSHAGGGLGSELPLVLAGERPFFARAGGESCFTTCEEGL
jgi:hypothetical protein